MAEIFENFKPKFLDLISVSNIKIKYWFIFEIDCFTILLYREILYKVYKLLLVE